MNLPIESIKFGVVAIPSSGSETVIKGPTPNPLQPAFALEFNGATLALESLGAE